MTVSSSILSLDELDSAVRLRVMFGFIWRSLLLGAASILVGGVIGFLTSGFFDVANIAVNGRPFPPELNYVVQVVNFFLGLLVGLVFLWIYVRWIFRVQFGEFRLRLVRNSEEGKANK